MENNISRTRGRFIGVGVGPGDPELLTLKAARLISTAECVSYLCNQEGDSQAKTIACLAFDRSNKGLLEIPIAVPMDRNRALANQAYDAGANKIRSILDEGRDVVFLCEGDPLFFGSFSYLLERLQEGFECQVVPGISSVNAAASALTTPLTMLAESFVVVSGRHTDQQISDALNAHDSVVIMKAGQSRKRILELLAQSGRTKDAQYLEYIGRQNERVVQDVSTLKKEDGPYFSLFVVFSDRRKKYD